MKKITISTIAIIMSVCFVALLYLQVSYVNTLVSMRKEHLYEGARRTLNQVAHKLEIEEVRRYLAEDNRNYIKRGTFVGGNPMVVSSYTTTTTNGGTVSTITVNTEIPVGNIDEEHFIKELSKVHTLEEAQLLHYDVLKMRAKYQRDVLDEVLFYMLDKAGAMPLQSRIDFKQMERYVRAELANNGIDVPFGIRVLDHDGRDTVYNSMATMDCGSVLSQPLFGNDAPARAAMLELSFSESGLNKFIYGSVKFMIPSLVFIFILLDRKSVV